MATCSKTANRSNKQLAELRPFLGDFVCGADRNRTDDPLLAKQVL